MTELRIEVVRDEASFFAMSREWDALVQRAGTEHPFLSHDWVRTWWECFGGDNELHVVTVRSGAELIGLAPLMRTRVRMYGMPVWRLEFIANVHTPRFDFIISERADEVYALIVDHLHSEGRWDLIMLPELAEGSRTIPVLQRLAEARSLRSGVWSAGASPRVTITGTFDAFLATLSGKRRRALRQRQRKLESLGAVSLEVVTKSDGVPGALEEGLRIEAAAWKGAAGTAIASHEELTRFYALVAERAARSATLRLMFLRVGDKRIAFAYCLRQGRTLYLLKTGYDPEYATHSPSNALMLLIIESAFREGLGTFDLLGCNEAWKRTWADDRTERRWLFLHRNTLRGLLLYYLKFAISPRLQRMRSEPPPEGAFDRLPPAVTPSAFGAPP